MTKLLHHITRSLSVKLIFTACLLILLGVGISWYVLITAEKHNLMKNAVGYTASYSNLIKKSVHYAMLTSHREAIQNTLEDVGTNKGIEMIRIFDKKGNIIYSSQRQEVGRLVERSSPVCSGCHAGPARPSETLKGAGKWAVYTDKERHRVLAFVEPLYNERSCYTAACHVHPEAQKILGILETRFSLFPVDENIRRQVLHTTLYAIGFMSLTLIVLGLFFWRFVHKPLSLLSKGMLEVAKGDLTQRIEVTSRDEIGLLAQTFNSMTEDLEKTTVSRNLLVNEVNERKQVEVELLKSRKKYKQLISSTMDGVFQVNTDGIFTMMNQAGARIFGYEHPEEIIGTNALEYWRDPKDRDAYRAELKIKKALSAYPMNAKKKNGEPIELESSSRILEDEKGNFLGIEGILRDVTERTRLTEQLRAVSLTDELTALYNRRGFLTLAEHLLKMADRSKKGIFMLYADLDGLKKINDTFGHQEGDWALIEIADLLRENYRKSDVLARIGGDEFVVIPVGFVGDNVEVIYDRLEKNLDIHNTKVNRGYNLSLSAGIAYYDPENPCSLDELLIQADKAMYEHKRQKKKS